MAVTVEMHNTGDPELQRDVAVMIEHVLSDRSGDWRVVIVGSQESDRWEMKIFGPNAFERSYTLEGAAGQHEPRVIGGSFSEMVAAASLTKKKKWVVHGLSKYFVKPPHELLFAIRPSP